MPARWVKVEALVPVWTTASMVAAVADGGWRGPRRLVMAWEEEKEILPVATRKEEEEEAPDAACPGFVVPRISSPSPDAMAKEVESFLFLRLFALESIWLCDMGGCCFDEAGRVEGQVSLSGGKRRAQGLKTLRPCVPVLKQPVWCVQGVRG